MKMAWCEDECTGGMDGHISLRDAWKHMFGSEWEEAKKEAVKVVDHGDGTVHHFNNGVEAWYGYDGGMISVPDDMVYKSVPHDLCCSWYKESDSDEKTST